MSNSFFFLSYPLHKLSKLKIQSYTQKLLGIAPFFKGGWGDKIRVVLTPTFV